MNAIIILTTNIINIKNMYVSQHILIIIASLSKFTLNSSRRPQDFFQDYQQYNFPRRITRTLRKNEASPRNVRADKNSGAKITFNSSNKKRELYHRNIIYGMARGARLAVRSHSDSTVPMWK